MKLTSTGRLRIVTLALVTILTFSIGSFISIQSYQSSIAAIDNSISSTIADAASAPNQELSAALFHIDQYALDLSLFLVSRDGSITTINESTIRLFDVISLEDVKRSTKKSTQGHGIHDYHFRSLEISGGDYLVVAASSEAASLRLKSALFSVLLITILTSIFAFFLFSLYIRRLKQRDDAEALARMQAFLGDASHELRTPLTVIKGYVEMLSKGQLAQESDKERAFSRVTSEIGRMESLVHDLLLLAELGESAARDREVLNLSEVVSRHSEDFALLNPTRSITIEISPEVEILAVRDYISRFVQNALNNISRHTAVDAPVRITLTRTSKRALLTIEDGGEGLPDSAYRKNIQSLNRFDKSRSRESGGSGLGMSIMAAVVEKCAGSLTLEKSSLGGLAVIAEIPLNKSE